MPVGDTYKAKVWVGVIIVYVDGGCDLPVGCRHAYDSYEDIDMTEDFVEHARDLVEL